MAINPSCVTFRLLSFIIQLSVATAACYYPDGSISPNDIPCSDDTEHSFCCAPGYACLSNKICQVTEATLRHPNDSEFARGSCTNQSWRNSACPAFCIDPDLDIVTGGASLVKCENVDDDVYYCVNAENNNVGCQSNNKNFIYFPGTPSVLTTIGVSPKTTSIAAATSSTLSQDAIASTSGTTSTSASASTLPTGSPSGSDSHSDSHISKGVIIGSSVGGACVLILVAILVVWLLRRRRQAQKTGDRNSQKTETAEAMKTTPVPQQDKIGSSHAHPVYHEAPTEMHTQVQELEAPYNQR